MAGAHGVMIYLSSVVVVSEMGHWGLGVNLVQGVWGHSWSGCWKLPMISQNGDGGKVPHFWNSEMGKCQGFGTNS